MPEAGVGVVHFPFGPRRAPAAAGGGDARRLVELTRFLALRFIDVDPQHLRRAR